MYDGFHPSDALGRPPHRFLDIPEWVELINDSQLYHKYFTIREARLGFIWSRMVWIDDCSTSKAYSRLV